jgi:hypothetical protein
MCELGDSSGGKPQHRLSTGLVALRSRRGGSSTLLGHGGWCKACN